MSGCNAQAAITASYFSESYRRPNSMLSRSVACCTHASCRVKPKPPVSRCLPITTSPPVHCISAATAHSSAVLPAPTGPIIPTKAPYNRSKDLFYVPMFKHVGVHCANKYVTHQQQIFSLYSENSFCIKVHITTHSKLCTS